ncbi:hypothetical protein ACCO45_004367 [Purpureocillium lilacinum]|uniref:Uncharacterized protein n=1 Tax=Purpureocillium lilacinum TaxID=33203 RepID=A0ACC4E3Y0_PURLI
MTVRARADVSCRNVACATQQLRGCNKVRLTSEQGVHVRACTEPRLPAYFAGNKRGGNEQTVPERRASQASVDDDEYRGKRRLRKGPSRSNAGPKKTGRDVEGA